jgi:hypothetical protein
MLNAITIGTIISVTAIFKASPLYRQAVEKSTSKPVCSNKKRTANQATVSSMFIWIISLGNIEDCKAGQMRPKMVGPKITPTRISAVKAGCFHLLKISPNDFDNPNKRNIWIRNIKIFCSLR